jgi:hypothetical protein
MAQPHSGGAILINGARSNKMAKLTITIPIPRLRYLAQDEDGNVYVYENMPKAANELGMYSARGLMTHITEGKPNTNWQESVIDLDTDEPEFEDGILRKIDK